MWNADFEPKLVAALREGYNRSTLISDLTAGVVVGIVALPLAIAFAIASGVKPEQGLYTAIIAGFLISLLSGSRVQIGGPTGAFIVIVYGIVQQHGYDGLAVATIMAGILLVVMGMAGLGSLIQFIPYPVTVGFTAGIAIIIAFSQVGDLLGLQLDTAIPAGFIDKFEVYAAHLQSFNPGAIALALATILIIRVFSKTGSRVPGSLIALIGTTAVVQIFGIQVETIGSRFGSVPARLPEPHIPEVTWSMLRDLSSPALSIALLAGIESLLSAVVADGMTGRRHRSNMEIIAQGIANIVSPLFGGIPATGAIARTATNIKNGGKTPIAGIVHALVLLLIMLFVGRWAVLIPMATLSGILVVVAYNMSEFHLFGKIMRSTRSDALVMSATFLLTVFIDLVVAIQVGVILAMFLFMRRMAEVTQVRAVKGMLSEKDMDDPGAQPLFDFPPEVEVYEIYGPFFFGAAHKFRSTMSRFERPPKVLILRMRHVLALDATGLNALEDLLNQTRREKTVLILSGVHMQPLELLQRSGMLKKFGEENVVGDIDLATKRMRDILRQSN